VADLPGDVAAAGPLDAAVKAGCCAGERAQAAQTGGDPGGAARAAVSGVREVGDGVAVVVAVESVKG
jgi:hypothetical protein